MVSDTRTGSLLQAIARHKRLADIAGDSGELAIAGDPNVVVSGVSYDSRAVQPGDLFVALRGGHFDGHNYLNDAVAAGASSVLVDAAPSLAVTALVAPDTRAALPGVAARFFGHPSNDIGVIGITGTDGKTTTSYLVDAILRANGRQAGMVGTVSVRIGDETLDHETRQTTPESVDIQRYLRLMVDGGCEWAVLEATSHGLDLHRLDEIRFAIGAVTNITHEHLEYHKTIAAYRRAKAILFERVSSTGGVAVINVDDEGAREMIPFASGARLVTYSMLGERADVCASDWTIGVTGSRFRLATPVGAANVHFPYLGGFNIANALCAVAIGLAADVPFDGIVRALETAPPVPGRMARVDQGQPFTVVVDYAHTPESLKKVLSLLRALNPTGRLIALSGSAGDRDTTKRPLQGHVSAELADISIFTTEDPRFEDPDRIIDDIAAGAIERGGREGVSVFRVTDRREAIRTAFERARPGDVVLLAGKGHEGSIIWGHEKRPWNERQAAIDVLREMGFGVEH